MKIRMHLLGPYKLWGIDDQVMRRALSGQSWPFMRTEAGTQLNLRITLHTVTYRRRLEHIIRIRP